MPGSWVEDDKDYYHTIERVSFTNNGESEYVTAEQFSTMAVTSNMPTSWSSEAQPAL
jgi:hypothetical protein